MAVVLLVFLMLAERSCRSVSFSTDAYERAIDLVGCPSDSILSFEDGFFGSVSAQTRAFLLTHTFQMGTADQVAATV